MSKSRWFILVSISFVVGILVASAFSFSRLLVLGLLGISCAVLGLWWDVKIISVVAVAVIFLILGALRMQVSIQPSEYGPLFGSKQKLEGVIVEDIDMRTDKQLIAFRPFGRHQNILITATKSQEFFYGDWIVVEGKVSEPQSFDDFDYAGYLERFNVYGLMRYPKVLILQNHRGNPIKEYLLRVKNMFVARISRVLAEPYSSLLTGILLGARKTLPQNITNNFTTTGLSHVVAVSGYNISIIILALLYFAKFIGRRASLVITSLFILSFVIMTGASASVVRAAIMGGLLLVSYQMGRLYAITPALCLAAALMLAVNPKILYFDVGFQLSFLATVGIVYAMPILEFYTASWPEFLEVKKNLLTTLSALVFTTPVIMGSFGRISLIAPLSNILVLVTVPYIMFFGFLGWLPIVGPGFALVARLLMAYCLWVVNSLSRIPFAAIHATIPSWVTPLSIGLIAAAMWWLNKKIQKAAVLMPGGKYDKLVKN